MTIRSRLFLAVLLFFSVAALVAETVDLSLQHEVGEQFMGVRLKGTVKLENMSDKGMAVGEMSGLAWSETKQVLYGVSNDGYLFHLKPTFSSSGDLVDARLLAAFPLLDRRNRVLKGRWRDAEGLALVKKGGRESLFISFEAEHRIEEYDPQGHWVATHPRPERLSDVRRFHSMNKGMEALAHHPKWGLLTSTELPLLQDDPNVQVIYSLDGKAVWRYRRSDHASASVVGLEAMPDGRLMMLERSFSSVFQPITISLYTLDLSPSCVNNDTELCDKELLANFSSDEGWNIDNFEGLSFVSGNGYFMISDNNRMWLQRTLLSYFTVESDADATNKTDQAKISPR